MKLESLGRTGVESRYLVTIDDTQLALMTGPAIASRLVEAVAEKLMADHYQKFAEEALKDITPREIAELSMSKIAAKLSEEVKAVKKAVEDKPVGRGSTTVYKTVRWSIF